MIESSTGVWVFHSLEEAWAARPESAGRRVLRHLDVGEYRASVIEYGPEFEYGLHAHAWEQIDLQLAGSTVERYGRSEREWTPGTVRATSQFAEHMTLTQRGWIRCCHVRGRKGTLRGALLDDPLHTDPRLAPIMFRLARELMEAGDEGRTLRVEALCDEVVRTATPDPISSAASQDLCARADEYLRANLDASPGLADIAIGIGVDRCHLARSFRRSRGCTIGEAARLLRLRRAFAELVESDLPLSAVAVRAGFADQSHFGRVFRARFGTTPGAVRRGR